MIKNVLYRAWFCLFVIVLFFNNALANDGPSPSNHITTLGIVRKVALHYLKYAHFKVIGACLWWKETPVGPSVYSTWELDEYLPDLVVSAYNGQGNDPWLEVKATLDRVNYGIGNALVKFATGFPLTNGNISALNKPHDNAINTKTVDVIGSPFMLLNFPFPQLRADAQPFMLYYQSDLDVLGGRTGIAESLRLETWDPFSHYIGAGLMNHWSSEFPRSMIINVNNDYKAAVIAALHAADIVTNKNLLHMVRSTDNSCGENCAVANVIEEQGDDHAIWQEVYPHDRLIQPGEDDSKTVQSLGVEDEALGHGNYVFVIWRHYRGCLQGEHFIMATVPVAPTEKR